MGVGKQHCRAFGAIWLARGTGTHSAAWYHYMQNPITMVIFFLYDWFHHLILGENHIEREEVVHVIYELCQYCDVPFEPLAISSHLVDCQWLPGNLDVVLN